MPFPLMFLFFYLSAAMTAGDILNVTAFTPVGTDEEKGEDGVGLTFNPLPLNLATSSMSSVAVIAQVMYS